MATPIFRTSSASILALRGEVLSTVFAMNADMFAEDEDALNTTRLSSQVCRDWRQIILHSPSLWGKLIDFDEVRGPSYLWLEEILRRSGNSLLWIKGWNTFVSLLAPSRKFIIVVLNKYWERIQKLALRVDMTIADDVEEPLETWRTLCYPAPHLQYFDVEFYGRTLMENNNIDAIPLFDSHAPSLRHFYVGCITFDAGSARSWLFGLRSLSLSHPISPDDILRVLEMTTSLEILHILGDDLEEPFESLSMPEVNLVNLKKMHVAATLSICLFFLEHINVPRGCSFSFQVSSISGFELLEPSFNFKLFIRRLAKYAEDIFVANPPHCLSLNFSFGKSEFNDSWGNRPAEASFSFSIPIICNEANCHSFILSECSFPSLSSVTKLWFKSYGYVEPAFAEQISYFLSGLPALEVLHADTQTLRAIMQSRVGKSGVLFPFLQILKTEIWSPYRDAEAEVLITFVHSRHQHGYPLAILDLTDIRSKRDLPLFNLFAGIVGMKILYSEEGREGVLEYVCN